MEYVVNLILIMRENIFAEVWEFFRVLLAALQDINERVREAALSLNEVLKDMIIEYVNSDKLDLKLLVHHFGGILKSLDITAYRNLVLEWIELFEGLPTFNLSDHFTYLYESLLDLLQGEYEFIMDEFYIKIQKFFDSFKNSKMSPRNFEDLLDLIKKGISRLREWKSPVGRIMLIALLYEQTYRLMDYLIYFNQMPKNPGRGERDTYARLDSRRGSRRNSGMHYFI